MFTLEVENQQCAILKLTQNESIYQIKSISGLTPPKATISTSSVANFDGQRFKDSKLEMRNIVILLKINGNVEKNRIALYDFFDNGQLCKIYYSNGTRKVFIEGYCETIDGDLFTNGQTMQISILCTDPYWKNISTTLIDISHSTGVFEFPFAIDENGITFSDLIENKETVIINSGDSQCGVIITLTAENATVVNPVLYDVKTGESLTLNISINSSEVVTINTNKGNKSIIKTVRGETQNVLNTLKDGSTWFQLTKGVNIYSYSADRNASKLKVIFSYNNIYKGV